MKCLYATASLFLGMASNMSKTKNAAIYSSDRQDWETPPDFLKRLLAFNQREAFDLDPCCTRKNVPAKFHYTRKEDGMRSSWAVVPETLAFMNHEYRESSKWIAKAVYEVQANRVRVWGLFPARLDTLYWHDYVFNHTGFVFFLRRRLQFWVDGQPYAPLSKTTGKPQQNDAPMPCALVYWGHDYQDVMARFEAEKPFAGTLVRSFLSIRDGQKQLSLLQ
jgi:hypothetical protein